MWNRHGTLLTIADCFRPALAALAKLASRGLVWADCEALERRHNLGRGTLVVLDLVPESGDAELRAEARDARIAAGDVMRCSMVTHRARCRAGLWC